MFFDATEYKIEHCIHLENKNKYGEVHTPENVVNDLINMLPPSLFNKDLTWLDVGAGKGNISVVLCRKLFEKVHHLFPSAQSCRDHILSKITLIELNPLHTTFLSSTLLFKNVICQDFLTPSGGINDEQPQQYDIIVSNPPFNSKGMIKVPLNKKKSVTRELPCGVIL